MLYKIILVLCAFFPLIHLSEQFNKIGKKIDLKRITAKYNEDSAIKIDITMRRFNRTHSAINANATLTDTIDNKYRFELELRVWSDGGWKRNYVTYANKDPCVQLKYTIGKTWNDIMKAAKVNYNCPYYAGKYALVDYYVDIANVPVLFAGGIFKALINIFKDNTFIILLDIDIEIRDVN